MTTHATGFSLALGNVEPQRKDPGDDAANAKEAHKAVSAVLGSDQKLQHWGLQTKLIGSYARRVSIRRVKDVDVFCRLLTLPDHWSPGEVLDHLHDVLLAEYGHERVTKQHRSVKVDFADFDLSVDAVPARPAGEDWEVPSRVESRHKWMLTNPLKLNDLTSEMNGRDKYKINGNGVYVPVIKLVRQIRRAHLDGDPPGGLFLELMTYWVFENGLSSHKTYAEYVEAVLGGIADLFVDVVDSGLDDPTIDAKISTKATEDELQVAADKFRAAADLATQALNETDECESARLWSRLLGSNGDGEVFPIPDYCSVDRAAASLAAPAFIPSRTPGADRVPERPGRFA